MVTLYVTPSCVYCRKAKAWLEDHQIAYKERNILSEPITIDEIKEILRLTEYGTDEIISTHSKAFQKLNGNIESLSLQELYKFIKDNPELLRRPLIIDEKKLQVGYNEEEIRRFMPRENRTIQLREAQRMIN
ncbi:transcriptional regulator SpxA [Bacillus sp. AFS031507]|uniref:transcriptional regulator SpxA n=1 Tax=Bacillus sp. AFS031507 TaxID=2033496 RepID=UPI000BFCF281|nr:transcriptional regulator SpxA [Bacillus sp. AFS031507]PGY07376.1 transcriptional regulator Spx [Bacillus sp. AFS031507]